MTSRVHEASGDLGRRLALLIGQAFSLGVAFTIGLIVANALFLTTYGPGTLPHAYVALGIVGAAFTYGFSLLLRRVTLPWLSVSTLLVFGLFFFLCWIGLRFASGRWITFTLIVAFPLLAQIGFVILSNQADQLLNARQTRRLFSWVIAGFILGMAVTGLALPQLNSMFRRVEDFLLLAVIACLTNILLLLLVARSHGPTFEAPVASEIRKAPVSLPKLLTNRLLLYVLLYQLLSGTIFQLSEYVFLTEASTRYQDVASQVLLFSNVTALLNTISLLFLLLVSAYAIGRFGLRAGLLANPVLTGLLLVAMLLVGVRNGRDVPLYFALAITTRAVYSTLSDGIMRRSVRTSYLALPAHERTAVKSIGEGIGGSLAIGLVGALLILLNAFDSITTVHVVGIALLLLFAWVILGSSLYKQYARALLATLRRRVLQPADISLDDPASLRVTEALVNSNDIGDVRLGLDTLKAADSPAYERHLPLLVRSPLSAIGREALQRIEDLALEPALPDVRWILAAAPDIEVKAAALRALCAILKAEAMPEVETYLDSAETELRRAALAGSLRYGGIVGALEVGPRLEALGRSSTPADRLVLAQVLGDVASAYLHEQIAPLLQDSSADVRGAALIAAGRAAHPALIPGVLRNLQQSSTRAAAMDAALSFGEDILPIVSRALAEAEDYRRDDVLRLVRLCSQIRGPLTVETLKTHLAVSDPEVREQVLIVLHFCEYQAEPDDNSIIQAQLKAEASTAARFFAIQQDLGEAVELVPLQRALRDALASLLHRVILLLSFMVDSRAIGRAWDQLGSNSTAEQTVALEFLEVNLKREEKALVLPLLDPKLSLAQRLEALSGRFKQEELSVESRLQALIADASQPWLQACAIFAVGKLQLRQCLPVVEVAGSSGDSVVTETAAWALSILKSSVVTDNTAAEEE